MKRRSKMHRRVILKVQGFRIVGACWGKTYSTDGALYHYEMTDGEDAMGAVRWKDVPVDQYQRMLLRLAEGLDQRRKR